MEFHEGKIVLDKVLNNLDLFTIDFTNTLKQHTQYALVLGYVSILFGRSRISENIDLLIPVLSEEQFKQLHATLLQEFWCLNAEDDLYTP